MNTPESSPTGNIHGMPLSTLLGIGNERLVNLCELPLDQLDHQGLRQALQVVDDALDDHAQPAISD